MGLVGLTMCLLAAKFLFAVPIRGSLLLIILISMLYLVVSLGLGLLISAATKNQFLASQIALVLSFLPALMLSGFIFDLRSVPAVVRGISRVLPPTYYVEALQTLFLAGNVWGLHHQGLCGTGSCRHRPARPYARQYAQGARVNATLHRIADPDPQGVDRNSQGSAQPDHPAPAGGAAGATVRIRRNVRSRTKCRMRCSMLIAAAHRGTS